MQNVGWQSLVSDGAVAGTSGKSLRVEALKISLENMPGYSIQYQVHVQNIGWQNWVSDGAEAGTHGKSLRIEAIRVKIVKISDNTDIGIQYQGHIQSIGWQNPVSNGQLSGTEGLSKRAEALKINLVNAPAGASIKYQAHVQNVGWQNWVNDGQLAGTVGKSLRVEALKITLENMPEGYSVQYQVHIQNIGWQNWVNDGQAAGTVGKSLRIEAIRIRILYHEIIHPTSVNLNKTSDSLAIGNTDTLSAVIAPSNASNKEVALASSNNGIVTADKEGKITALGAGTAVITVVAADGGKTASCTVTVSSNKPADFRVLIIGDIHYDSNNYFDTTKEARANYIINYINWENTQRPIDMVIINGDCSSTTLGNANSSLIWFTDFAKNYLPRLNVPYYVVHGNHDEVSDEQWSTFFKTQKNFTVVKGDYAFICVDNFNEPFDPTSRGSGHTQSKVDMTWFNEQVANLKDKKIIVVGHYMSNLYDTELIQAINNTSNIICAFDAHMHNLTETTLPSGKKIYMNGFMSYGTPDPSFGSTGHWCYKNMEIRGTNLIEETIFPAFNYPACSNIGVDYEADNQSYTSINTENIIPVQ